MINLEYIEDYYKEALDEMNRCLGIEVFTEDKEGVYKENYYFRDHLQIPYISDLLAKEKTRNIILEFVSKFLDDHATQLSTSGPVYKFTFGDKETSVLYDLFNITKEKILEMYEEMVKETYYGNISLFFTGWVKNAPHKILITSILIEALQKGYSETVECCEYLWAFSEYPILYNEYWSTGVKEDVMNYTIEHLGSKFQVRKVKNIQELIKYDAHASVTAHEDRLKTGADNEYLDFMQRIRSQMNSKFKNISRVYYVNNKNNASQHSKQSTFDDGTLVDQEGITTNLSQIIDNTVSKFMSGSLNNSMIKVASESNKVDKNNLTGFLNQVWGSKDNKLSRLVENIITAYFSKNPTSTSVGSSEFINFGLGLYRSIGASKDPLYIEIKSIMNYWIHNIVDIKQYYSREPTWIVYTRAMFDYVVLMIVYYN